MGDPRKLRNKSSRPRKLWDAQRLTEEKGLKKEFGLKNMRELWTASEELKKYRREARRLLSHTEEERKVDSEKILSKLTKLNVLKQGATLDDVLSLTPRDILERRLQTIVFRKGLAATIIQSRQLITHGFVMLDGSSVSSPSYQVGAEEENAIAYAKQINIEIKPKKEEAKPAKPEAPATKSDREPAGQTEAEKPKN